MNFPFAKKTKEAPATEVSNGGESSAVAPTVPDSKVKRSGKGGLFPLLGALAFTLAFWFFGGDMGPVTDITNQSIIAIFESYGRYMGAAFALLSLIAMYLVYGLVRLVQLGRFRFLRPIILAAGFLPWYLLGDQLLNREPRYTDIARALISYLGEPLIIASVFIFILAGIWLAALAIAPGVRFLRRQRAGTTVAGAALLIVAPLLLTGCVGDFMLVLCDFLPDSDHCIQGGAVQEGRSEECEKISGDKFKDGGSNPPRDKCYLLIAENTGDLSACEQIRGGFMSYTRDECLLSAAIKHLDPAGCAKLSGADQESCRAQIGPKLDPGAVIEIDDQIALVKDQLKTGADPDLEAQLKGLEEKRNGYLDTMSTDKKTMYESLSDPNNRAASLDYHLGKIDEETRNTLVALNDRLRGKGESMKESEYQAIRDLLAYKNDPDNDIENMDPAAMLKLRWNEKVGNAVDYLKFWNSNPTKGEEALDQQLFIYQRMLERQAAIEQGMDELQQDTDRNIGMVRDYLKDKAWEKGMDEAKKAAFGELMDLVDSDAADPVSTVLGEAIDTVKKEAQSKEFRGLVRAYNLGMQEELAKAGGNVEKAHAAVVANLNKNAYEYEDQNTFAKYGNILENPDCDGNNPHCIKRDVFWKAMKKSYQYQSQAN